ncbi:SIR2 family protein [Lactococcus lactis]|uniref:SIR2 family protein n=1 Tax=Lactococcus lactis TaxID=1358 RepID=UPI0022E5DF67|nr:SIR2 family protein [Lactococcus lactis]
MSDEQQNMKNNEIVKNLRKLAITKQLNFLIGSGTSYPAIPLMGMIKEEKTEERNKMLAQKVKMVSSRLLEDISEIEQEISITLENYVEFISKIIDILNLSNSRQTPRTTNLFTTNYDLFIEKASDKVLHTYRFVFNDGASGYFERKLDSSNYNRTVSYKGLNDNYTNEIPSVTLIKPHGSMNWEKKDDSVLIRNTIVDSPVIVKPTGYEEQETFYNNHFHEMLRVFQLELDKPQSVLFVIGFSFQDNHISKMIKRAIQNPELIVYAFGFTDEDRHIYLENLGLTDERNNFIILTPKDFSNEYRTLIHSDKGEDRYSFTLSNLTGILRGASLEDLKNGKS